MNSWPLSAGLQGGTWYWPVDRRVYLLMDGVRIEQLARRLYEWSSDHQLDADLLYAGTPLADVSDVSPWLIALPDTHHPVLQAFLAQGVHAEWGYLIESHASLEDVGNHLRHMLQVRHPSGVAMWLRLADPAVIAALLPDQSAPAMVPWGPIEGLVRPDAIAKEWVKSTPQSAAESPIAIPSNGYLLNETQVSRLQACDKRRDLRTLLHFVEQHCPEWRLPVEQRERYDLLAALTQSARGYGFTNPRQWGLLCTLFSRERCTSWSALSEQVPELHACLTTTEASPSERLKTAFTISSYSETT
ncbi:DUF4123 domain-containing protein [Halomonas sp. Mc5H-6]|uniref:DUF4123 domain-containing protein n=1 Tax=Halomonas sp. Mc5H-6 TaxID=2954500 RepID=UPI002096C187|nr:DUF4123 domain-containing protein [Halomonas sp. Mc5H-6]MCO7247973.1 DUF4123 domain-containing protein [Halomonas sp. Mc5H-6]